MKTQISEKADESMPNTPSAPKPLARFRAANPKMVETEVKLEPMIVEAAKESKSEKEAKVPRKLKLKVVRDSFTMPQSEYLKIAEIKALCLKAGVQVKKSEVLRAGVIALCAMNEKELNAILNSMDKIKTGRPYKD